LHADDGVNLMLWQRPCQLLWHVLIEENFQGCA
jgi:hypothetical protein